MTHTAEPMTLAHVSDSLRKRAKAMRESEDYVEGISDRMADWFDVRADAIDAELAKQREAGPVEVTDEMVQVAAKAICKWAGDDPDGTEGVLGYRQVDQQTIVNKVPNWYGYADYARAALSAVASRDREDAEHQLRDLHRAIESNLTGSSIEQGKSPTEYKEGLIKAYGHCREMVSKRINAIKTVRGAVNAARRENKP